MIELIRIKSFLKIKEFRYPEKLIIDNSFDIIKIYSFKNLDKKGWLKESHCTMMVNLLKSNDLLFKDMNKNYQKHIRREEREEIEVSLTNKEEDFLSFYNGVYLNLCRDKKLKKYPCRDAIFHLDNFNSM